MPKKLKMQLYFENEYTKVRAEEYLRNAREILYITCFKKNITYKRLISFNLEKKKKSLLKNNLMMKYMSKCY